TTLMGIQLLMEEDDRLEIIGTAKNGKEAILKIKAVLPDVVLLDYILPDMSATKIIHSLSCEGINLPFLIYSGHASVQYIQAAHQAGAKGYALKGSDTLSLRDAVVTIANGGTWFSPLLSYELSKALQTTQNATISPSLFFDEKETNCLHLLGQGMTPNEIASATGVSDRTVRNWVNDFMIKLGLRSREQVTVWAVRQGFGEK
ncbi:MAG: response regulator transcription factor, partial [Anaerolineales bacterium]|nr:response regulator transcription factor [Anaerolineales bacterium]